MNNDSAFAAITASLDRMAYAEALAAAERISKIEPDSGRARFLRAEALYHLGRYPDAMLVAYAALADETVIHSDGSGGGLLGLVVTDGFRSGRIRETADYLLERYPVLARPEALAPATGFGSLAAPLHAVQYLALLQAKLGRSDVARALNAHHGFLTENFLTRGGRRSLTGIQHWLLASVSLGRLPPSRVLDHLDAAWDSGFKEGWGFNYRLHATFAPLWDHPRYRDLIDRIEVSRARSEMVPAAASGPR